MAKYYINEYIKNITKKNSNIEELDDVEKELDKIANKLLEKGVSPFDENPYGQIFSKNDIDNVPQGVQLTIIKQDDDYKYGILTQTDESSFDGILVNEEHFNYFNNKFIKYSAKDFIIKSLIHYVSHSNKLLSLVNADDYESDEELIQAIIDTLALDRFKFPFNSMVLNDIDIIDLNNDATLLFDKNEIKKIFNVYLSKDSDRHLLFAVEGINNNIAQVTTYIDGNEYKRVIQGNQ